MKFIPFAEHQTLKTREVILTVASQPSAGQGINYEEMRKRVRILDAVESAGNDGVHLEDADHTLLKELIGKFQFALAHPKLLSIIDDVIGAK